MGGGRFKKTPRNKLQKEKKMALLNVRAKQALISATMIALALITGYGLSQADNPSESTAVFFVG